MKIVLYRPRIPQNTGNIIRTCSVVGSDLQLVGDLGFSLQDRWLKRAGLDYFEGVNVTQFESWESWADVYLKNPEGVVFFSSRAKTLYTNFTYTPNMCLVFGSETEGLPETVFNTFPTRCARLPMIPGARCLNLATSAGIAIYEAWRQQGFQQP